jgi:hypothetical protein
MTVDADHPTAQAALDYYGLLSAEGGFKQFLEALQGEGERGQRPDVSPSLDLEPTVPLLVLFAPHFSST